MKKILVIAALLAFSTSVQAQSEEQKLCLGLVEHTESMYTMWRAGMDPADIIRSLRASMGNNESFKEVISLVVTANVLHYHRGTDVVSAKKQIAHGCREAF